MENKELLREFINDKITSIDLSSGVTINFGDESINIIGEHEQDCCENVYADLDSFKHYVDNIVGKNVKELIIKGVSEIGFLLCFYFDYDVSEKVFIPCYNSQNGYYSSHLDLIITRGGIKKTIDISEFVEDDE